MGIHSIFAGGFAKAELAAQIRIPSEGHAFLSVMDEDKAELLVIAERLARLGFSLVATSGTADFLRRKGFEVAKINKVRDGSPHIVDSLAQREIDLVINTPEGPAPLLDSRSIRLVANEVGVPTFTTLAAADAATRAIKVIRDGELMEVLALQDYHALLSQDHARRRAAG